MISVTYLSFWKKQKSIEKQEQQYANVSQEVNRRSPKAFVDGIIKNPKDIENIADNSDIAKVITHLLRL